MSQQTRVLAEVIYYYIGHKFSNVASDWLTISSLWIPSIINIINMAPSLQCRPP